MDKRTQEEMRKISQRVTAEMTSKGLEKVDKGPSMQETLRDAYKGAKTLSERRAIDTAMRKTEGMVEKDSYQVSEEYSKAVDKKMDYEIKKAMKTGKIKPADKHEYAKYMNRLHKK